MRDFQFLFSFVSRCRLLDVSKYNSSFPRAPEFQLSERLSYTFETLRRLHQILENKGLNSNWSSRPIRRRVNNRLPWQQFSWELGSQRKITPTLTPNSLGNSNEMQIRCKWGGLDEFIKNNFIPVLPVFQIGIVIWSQYFSFFPSVVFLILICRFLFPSLSIGGPLEHLAPETQPCGRGGWTRLRRAHQSCFPVLPRSGVFHSGDSRKFCPRKTALPRTGCKKPRKGRTSLFQDDPQTTSGVPGKSSFPFLERTSTGSPSECERFPPTGETHGALAGQDSIPRGGSQGRAWSVSELRHRTGGYRFRNHNSCGTKE